MSTRARPLLSFLAAALYVASMLLPESALAAIGQCGVYGSRWAGWTTADYGGSQPTSGIEGSSAYIYTNYSSAICGTDTDSSLNFTMSYDMVYDHSRKNYAQAGTFWGYGLPCVYEFVEQAKNDVHTRKLIRCTADGERHAYRNLMTGNPYRVVSYIDGVGEMVSNYDPFDTWQEPFDIQFMGETKYLQSDIPGIPNYKENFTAMGVQRFDNDNLVTACGYVILARFAGTPGRYATDDVSCSHVRTWTQDV